MPQHTVYISPNHMDPTYQLERDGLGPDVELKSWSATDPSALAVEIAEADAVLTWRVPATSKLVPREDCGNILQRQLGTPYCVETGIVASPRYRGSSRDADEA